MSGMSLSLAPANGTHQSRLVEAGFAIALSRGIGALSARGLAERLRVSGSTMNYHFGNRDRLLVMVQERAAAACEVWRAGQAGAGTALAPWTTTAELFLAMIQARLGDARELQVLLFEFAAQASRHDFLFAAAKGESEADGAFWRRLARDMGASEREARAWSDLSLGLRLVFSPEADATVRALWISGALARLGARLANASVAPITISLANDAAARLRAQTPRNETAARIVEAALRVIAQKGASRMSQRDVAAVAGVSQASVTYFYRTRANLIAAAASALHREIQGGVLGEAERMAGPTGWASQVIDDLGNFRWRRSARTDAHVGSGRHARPHCPGSPRDWGRDGNRAAQGIWHRRSRPA